MNNILVTGGAGFIGTNFIRYMLTHEPEVHIINLDALTYAGSLENLKNLPDESRHTFVEGNIKDRGLVEGLLRQHNIDAIVHFAAETHVDRSILGPEEFVQTNIVGTFQMLEAARQVWIKEDHLKGAPVRFHHVSTDEVFGTLSPTDPPFEESTPYAPRSPYAASKAASDHLVRSYFHTYGLPVSITNCSNNYGPYQFPEKLIPLMILNARDGKPLPIYGDGQQIRDWLFVDDHSEAIRQVLKNGRVGQTYCVGGENQPPNLEVVETICEIIDELRPESPHAPHNSLLTYVKDRPGHDRRYDVATGKLRAELSWKPQESLTTGMLKTVKWYLDNPAWIDAVLKEQEYQAWLQKNYDKR